MYSPTNVYTYVCMLCLCNNDIDNDTEHNHNDIIMNIYISFCSCLDLIVDQVCIQRLGI